MNFWREAACRLAHWTPIAFGRGPGAFTGRAARRQRDARAGLRRRSAGGADLGPARGCAQRVLRPDAPAPRVLVCNDARMQEVYWACFERGAAWPRRAGGRGVGG